MRNFDDLFSLVCSAIPTLEELAALSTEEIERLRKLGNIYDNQLYLEVMKRENAAKNTPTRK